MIIMTSHACLALLLFVQTVLSAGPFQSWEISSSTLSTTRYHAFVAYNEESVYSDCIFIFGGIGCTTCMQCYNITDNSIFTYDTLTTGGYSEVQSSAVMIVDKDSGTEVIYFLTTQGYIQKYNILTKTETTKYYNSGALQACLLKNENDSELYIVDGAGGSSFWIYDLIDSELVTGPSLTYARDDSACTTSYWNEDEPYLYVLGGYTATIERIKINGLLNDIENNYDLYKWEILWLQLTSTIDDRCTFAYQSQGRHMAVVTYQNYIYLIGGYDGSSEADITYLDVENWEFKYAGEYVAARWGIRCQYASLTQRMYCFGGTTTNQIAFTNIAISTPSSSSSTTTSESDVIIMPSQAPTNPTTNPTNMLTVVTVATYESPTNNFTTSAHPTVQPTLKPSDTPTINHIPTLDPTTPPAYTFIDVVSTLIPTQSPIISLISTTGNDEDSSLTSNSESSVSTADLESLMNEPLIITIIVLICLILVCCCCVGCCSISYLLYNKCLNKNNDNNNNSDNKNNDHNNNNNNNNNGGKLEIEMKKIDANNCKVDINDVDDDDDRSLLENDQSIGNTTDKNEKIEGEHVNR